MGKKIWMFIPLSLLFFLSVFYRNSSAIIASELMSDLSLRASDLGLLSSSFFYAFALVQIPMGVAMDLFGPKRLIMILSSLGIAGALFFAMAPSLPFSVLGRSLLGVGMACALMGPMKLFTVWFPVRAFATLSGVLISIGVIGSVVATAPLAIAVDWMGWRKSFLSVALIHLFITVWIYLVVREYPKEEGRDEVIGTYGKHRWKKSMRGIRQVLSLPSFWLIALTAFVRYGTYISIAGLWAGPYLEFVYQLPLVERGKMLMSFPIGYIVGSPIFGILSDRVFKNRKGVTIIGTGLYTFSIFPLIGFIPLFTPGILLMVLFCIGFFSSSGQLLYAHIKDLFPRSLSGTALTTLNLFVMGGAAFFQHIMGAMIDKFSITQGQISTEAFPFAFGFCFVAAAIGTAAYLFVKEVRL